MDRIRPTEELRKRLLGILNDADNGHWLATVRTAKAKGVPRREIERRVKRGTPRVSLTRESLLLIVEEVYERE